jgi:enoyl-CoA hydratase/carnithine racemase
MTVLAQLEGRIGRITLDRSAQMNAITIELVKELERAVSELARSADVIVIRGAGGNFSVGGDIDEVERLRHDGPGALRNLFDAFAAACDAIASARPPVLAAVEGHALAGGFELMLACDVAIVRDDAVIGDHHSRAGVIPGGGSTQRLPRLVGRQRALGLILTGDHLSGAQAAEWGLAYRAVGAHEFERATDELAQRLAGRDPAAQAAIKRLVRDEPGLAREREEVSEFLAAQESVTWAS